MKRILAGILIAVLIVIVGAGLYVRSELPNYRTAFLYAFGPYEFTRSIQDFSGQREGEGGLFNADSIRSAYPDWTGGAFLNRHIHNGDLSGHTLRTVTTPNNDTLYTSAVLELSATPVELIVPEVGSRYLSIALMDVFTDQFAHIGPRETRGQAGTYWILGPEDASVAPSDVTVIRAPGNDVWLLARTFVSGTGDLDAARIAQQGIVVRPVDPQAEPKPFATAVTEIDDSGNFLAVVNETLARNPQHSQSQRAQQYSKLGLGAGSSPGFAARRLWGLVTPRAEAAITAQVEQQMSANTGWSNPPENIGDYGEDDVTRSAIALIGFGALRRADAIYYRMTRSQNGTALDGTRSYQMTLPENVPAEAFWSIALYEPDETGRYFFYETATGRHSLNSGSESLVTNSDGSVSVHIGPSAPSDPSMNWMPTPDGPFAAFFRLYLPEPRAISEDWMPPELIEH